MARNLIVLSDGTGNSAAAAFKTNVWRLYQALDLTDGSQVAEFGDGVGSAGVRFLRVLGLAFGYGVKRNVLNLYKFLCHNYSSGDRIWVFGFSRGAFTVRLLVGLIHREGLITFDSEAELNRNALAAYRAYRKVAFHSSRLVWVTGLRLVRDLLILAWCKLTGTRSYKDVKNKTFDRKRSIVNVHFLGVWDTVVAYGLPIDELTQAFDKWVWPMKFRDTSLLPNVEHARHALSLDDERQTFSPIPWDEAAEKDLRRQWPEISPDRLQQVWFPGAHADVGGGYPDDGLSYVALGWMIEEAAKQGLRFEPNIVATYAALAAPTGRIYDSRSGLGAFWRYQPRNVEVLMGAGNTPLVHGSVVTRMACGNDGYAPISLPEAINVLAPHGAPVAFDSTAVAAALAGTTTAVDQSCFYVEKAALKKRCQFLTDMQQFASAGGTARTDRFALVMDTVWWRRVTYFVSLALASFAAAFPLFQQYFQLRSLTRVTGGLANSAAGSIAGFVPTYAKPWVDAVVSNTPVAVLVLLALLISLRFSGFLQRRIYDRARAAWNPAGQVGAIAIDRLALTGQRGALTKGVLGFGALAIFVGLIGTGKHVKLLSFFLGIGLGCLVGLAWLILQRRHTPGAKRIDPARPGLFLEIARKARNSRRAVSFYKHATRQVIPAVVFALGGLFFVIVVNRTGFDLISAGGGFCHSPLNLKTEKIDTPSAFRTNSMCHATGLWLIAGREYRIVLEMKDPWFDKGERSDIAGFAAASLPHYLASPLKRWWWENWFQPVARIGRVGNYEHALHPAAPLPVADFSGCRGSVSWQAIMDIPAPASPQFMNTEKACEIKYHVASSSRLIADITADASGELFLYVNDAVLFEWSGFYHNNSGTAAVTVTRILAPKILPAGPPDSSVAASR